MRSTWKPIRIHEECMSFSRVFCRTRSFDFSGSLFYDLNYYCWDMVSETLIDHVFTHFLPVSYILDTNLRIKFPILKVYWSLHRNDKEYIDHVLKNWCLSLSFLLYSVYRFYVSSLFIFSYFIFIIIVIGICFEIISLRCAWMKKWKWFLSVCLSIYFWQLFWTHIQII